MTEHGTIFNCFCSRRI